MSALGLIGAIDRLFESAVADPDAVDERFLADWVDDLAVDGPLDRRERRAVRRATRLAVKLAAARPKETDWQEAVDANLGSGGWQPTLDLAQYGLETSPTPELFAEMQRRFRLVYLRPWGDGADYESFMESRRT